VERPGYERIVELVRERLEPGAFAAAWAEGRAMEWEQAVTLARAN
jgi:hypothetical protein